MHAMHVICFIFTCDWNSSHPTRYVSNRGFTNSTSHLWTVVQGPSILKSSFVLQTTERAGKTYINHPKFSSCSSWGGFSSFTIRNPHPQVLHAETIGTLRTTMQFNSFLKDNYSCTAVKPSAKFSKAKSRTAQSIKKALHLNPSKKPQSTPKTNPTGPTSKSKRVFRKLKTFLKRHDCRTNQSKLTATNCLANDDIDERLKNELIESSSNAPDLDHIDQVLGSSQLPTILRKVAWKSISIVHSTSATTMETWESSMGLAPEPNTPQSEVSDFPSPEKHLIQPLLDAISLEDNGCEEDEDSDNDSLGRMAHTENYDISSDSDSDDEDDDFTLATAKTFTLMNEVSCNKLTTRAATLRRKNNKLHYSPRLATIPENRVYPAPQLATTSLISKLRPEELDLLSVEPPKDTLANKLYTLRRQAMESEAKFNCLQLPATPGRLSKGGYNYGR